MSYVRITGHSKGKPITTSPSTITAGMVSYDPDADELMIEVNPQTVAVLGSGRDLVVAFQQLMQKADETLQDREDAITDESVTCDQCGAEVLTMPTANGTIVMLDKKPSERGVYVFAREGKVRTLRPFEEPIGMTFRKHVCGKGG